MAASGVGELGSANDPDAVAPGGAGSPGDAVEAAGATDKAEGTGNIAETSQLIVTGETAGGITISGVLSGRIKHATNPLLGTDDTSPSFNLAFAGATVSNGIFDVEIASRFTAPIQAGSFSVTATEQPFGSGVLTGNGFLTSDQEFVLYELTDQSDGHKIFGWAGVPTTTFPTTGATFYNFRRDFVMDSDVPFVSKASGGSIISKSEHGRGRRGDLLGHQRVVLRAAPVRCALRRPQRRGREPTVGDQCAHRRRHHPGLRHRH